jgi:hypothetical protein
MVWNWKSIAMPDFHAESHVLETYRIRCDISPSILIMIRFHVKFQVPSIRILCLRSYPTLGDKMEISLFLYFHINCGFIISLLVFFLIYLILLAAL